MDGLLALEDGVDDLHLVRHVLQREVLRLPHDEDGRRKAVE